jgi:hypothetical protein
MGSAVLGQSSGDSGVLRKVGAALDVFSRLRLPHTRPDYDIKTVELA